MGGAEFIKVEFLLGSYSMSQDPRRNSTLWVPSYNYLSEVSLTHIDRYLNNNNCLHVTIPTVSCDPY